MPIPLRADFDARMVRAAARWSKDGPQARRLLALAAIYDGASRTEAAKIGGVTLQIVRDWVMKFNAHGPEGLIDCKPPGQPSRLNGAHRAALAAILESGPIPAVHGVVRWRIVDLCQWIFEEFRVVVAKQTLSRELRAMGYRKLSARPRHHEQAEGAIEDFKKLSRAPGRDRAREGRRARRHRGLVRRRGPHRPKEQDHPPLGQARHASERADGPTNRLGLYLRRDLPQARKGCSPDHAQMQHGGHEPAPGRNRRSDRAGRTRGASRRSQAGWHLSSRLVMPPNITLIPLPAKCPELNPQENVWQFLRDNWLSNRIFKSYDDVVDHCCEAWNNLVDQPWRIMSIGLRNWAHGS